jgi:hypothetical protein
MDGRTVFHDKIQPGPNVRFTPKQSFVPDQPNVRFAPKADIQLDAISKFHNLKIVWVGSADHLRRIERLPALRQGCGHHRAPKPSAPRPSG